MKKLILGCLAIVLTINFTSCESETEIETSTVQAKIDYNAYQQRLSSYFKDLTTKLQSNSISLELMKSSLRANELNSFEKFSIASTPKNSIQSSNYLTESVEDSFEDSINNIDSLLALTSDDQSERILELIAFKEILIFLNNNQSLFANGEYSVQGDCGWWKSWGKCAAGILGGAISGGIGGAAAGAGVGAAVGSIGAGVGAIPGAVVGAKIGGVLGTIGGALEGAAGNCDGCNDKDDKDKKNNK